MFITKQSILIKIKNTKLMGMTVQTDALEFVGSSSVFIEKVSHILSLKLNCFSMEERNGFNGTSRLDNGEIS